MSPPSPFRSLWTFIAYSAIFYKPVWGIVSILGDVDFVVGQGAAILSFLDTAPGIALLIVAGFSLLAWDNHRRRTATGDSGVEQAPSLSPPPTQPDEAEELRTSLREVEQKREQAQTDKRALSEKLEQTRKELEQVQASEAHPLTVSEDRGPTETRRDHEKRKGLKRALVIAHSKGVRLDLWSASYVSVLGSTGSDSQAFRKWENETYALLRAAFVEKKHAESFLAGSGVVLSTTPSQRLLADRLWSLVWTIIAADNAELRPDFNPQEWMSLK